MMMEVESLPIHEVKVLKTKKFGDARSYFSEICNRRALADAGIDEVFIQNSLSLSATRGTVRGLHFHLPPLAQAKLVRVLRGNIPNVAIDWPVAPADAVLSAKDLALPALAGLPDCFFCEPMDSGR
jgi:dTDP-4-dehydrorhamnose 3,5-epimerase-like enzyme